MAQGPLADWFTNDPETAALLRAADRAHERARTEAMGLPLAEKLKAHRAAREARDESYSKIVLRT